MFVSLPAFADRDIFLVYFLDKNDKLPCEINYLAIMKKIVFFMTVLFAFALASCSQDEPEDPFRRPQTPGSEVSSGLKTMKIEKLYSVVMRRELPYPFPAYVMQLDNGGWYYMLRYRYSRDLKIGDNISFSVFDFCPNEIAKINGCDLGDGSDAGQGEYPEIGDYLVASDPIEATVKEMFAMKIRYSITFYPIDTWFIETEDGNLIFVKKSKLTTGLKSGDRFVYNVYTLFPNEILAIKKL